MHMQYLEVLANILKAVTLVVTVYWIYVIVIRPHTRWTAYYAGGIKHPEYVGMNNCLIDGHKIGTVLYLRCKGRVAKVTVSGAAFETGVLIVSTKTFNTLDPEMQSDSLIVTVDTY